MDKAKALVFLISITPCLYGCGDSSAGPSTTGSSNEYTVIHKGSCCSTSPELDSKILKVYKNQSDYEEQAVLLGHQPETIDFETHMVVFASMGEKPSTGYFLNVVNADTSTLSEARGYETNYITVELQNTIPTGDCITGDAITTPHIFIKTPTASNVLIKETLVTQCG